MQVTVSSIDGPASHHNILRDARARAPKERLCVSGIAPLSRTWSAHAKSQAEGLVLHLRATD
jgi:hypothetical protein